MLQSNLVKKRDQRSSLLEKDYTNLRISATVSLSSKFNLMELTEAGDDKMTSTYTINMVLQSFKLKLQECDMQESYNLVTEDPTKNDGSILADTTNLLEHYDD